MIRCLMTMIYQAYSRASAAIPAAAIPALNRTSTLPVAAAPLTLEELDESLEIDAAVPAIEAPEKATGSLSVAAGPASDPVL